MPKSGRNHVLSPSKKHEHSVHDGALIRVQALSYVFEKCSFTHNFFKNVQAMVSLWIGAD